MHPWLYQRACSGDQTHNLFCHPGWLRLGDQPGPWADTVAPSVSGKRTAGRPRRELKCTARASLVLFSYFFILQHHSTSRKNHHQAFFSQSHSCNSAPVSQAQAHQPHTPKPKMVSPSCPGHPFLDGVNNPPRPLIRQSAARTAEELGKLVLHHLVRNKQVSDFLQLSSFHISLRT